MASQLNLSPSPGIPPAVSKEINPDWLAWIDQEEGENLAQAIVDGIVTRGQEVLFEKHIESQVLPYAVQFAKGTLLTIIQWEFFKSDKGHIHAETWAPDEEPLPAVIDSWARGAIPVRKPPAIVTPAQIKPKQEQAAADLGFSVEDFSSETGLLPVTDGKGSVGSVSSRVSSSKKFQSQNMSTSNGSRIFGKVPQGSVRRGLSSMNDNADMTAATMAERAILEENRKVAAKLLATEKEGGGKADIGYDSEGRILVVKKAGATKLLTQGVRAKVVHDNPPSIQTSTSSLTPAPPTGGHPAIVRRKNLPAGPFPSKFNSKTTISSATLGAKSKDTRMSQIAMSRTTVGLLSTSSLASAVTPMVAGVAGAMNLGFVPDTTLDIPLLTETMKLAPGVTLKEGEVIKKGPSMSKRFQDRAVADTAGGKQTTKGFVLAAETALEGDALTPKSHSDTTVSSATMDPVLSTVLSKAHPNFRAVPFPALAVRHGGEDADLSNHQAYPKLPNIKGVERKVGTA